MNFTQLQERVRLELLRRIERGTLSVSLLARQTGLGQGHISNFLRMRRQLSLGTLDKIMAAQRMGVADLLPSGRETGIGVGRGGGFPGTEPGFRSGEMALIPLVSPAVAMFERYIRDSSVQRMVPFPADLVEALRPRCTPARKQWERFVVMRVGAEEARAMEPVLMAEAMVLLDRQFNSFKPYEEVVTGVKNREARPNVYGVRVESRLVMRYADYKSRRLVLRPHGLGFPVEVMEVPAGEDANELLVGRVALVLQGG